MENIDLTDRIIGKSNQIIGKIDRFCRTSDYSGNNLTKVGLFLGAASIITGIAAIGTIVAAPASLIGIAAATNIASFGGMPLAGTILLAGGYTGISLMGLGKLYHAIRGEHDIKGKIDYMSEKIKVINHYGELSEVNSVDILKQLEYGDFFLKYKSVQVGNSFVNPTPNEPIEKYVKTLGRGALNNIYNKEELATAIRREMFLEEKNPSVRKILSDRIKSVREGSISNTLSTTKKYN